MCLEVLCERVAQVNGRLGRMCHVGKEEKSAQATAHTEALPQSTAWRSRLLGEQTRVTGAQGVGTGVRGNEEAEEAEKG